MVRSLSTIFYHCIFAPFFVQYKYYYPLRYECWITSTERGFDDHAIYTDYPGGH